MLTTIKVTAETSVIGTPELITNVADIAAGTNVVLEMADTSAFSIGSTVKITSDAGSEYTLVTAIVTNTSITVSMTSLIIDVTTPTIAPYVEPVSEYQPGMYILLDNIGNAEWTNRQVLYGHVLDGKTVSQLLTASQKAYLEAKLAIYAPSIDLVLMP